MSKIETHWESLSDEKWENLARNYLRCEETDYEDQDEDCLTWGQIVTRLGMWGSAESLWHFLRLTLSLAETDRQLGGIAAGPIEYLLGRFGPEYIDRVENEVAENPQFAAAIRLCNQYMMTDEVWARVQKLQAR
jgi:hypothetical protein